MITEYYGTSGQRVVIQFMKDGHLLNAYAMYKQRLEVMQKIASNKANKYVDSLTEIVASLKAEIDRRKLI
jgi:tripartite-type tricarboxylate transporter receptor subunit TctC